MFFHKKSYSNVVLFACGEKYLDKMHNLTYSD